MEQGKYYKLISSDAKSNYFNLGEVWQYKDMILLLVKRNFVSRYKQTILGPAWAVIQPLLTTIVFTFIFGNVAGLANCGAVPTFLFYMCGNIAWHFFSGCLSGTANTFVANRGIMGKVYFPRISMPIASVLSNLISFSIQSAMFLAFLVIYHFVPGYSIETNWYEKSAEDVLSYGEYRAIDPADEQQVTVEGWVQLAAYNAEYGNASIFLHDKIGAYYVYRMNITEEDAAKLVPGAYLKLTGYKKA